VLAAAGSELRSPSTLLPHLAPMGGSDVQREVVEDTAIAALVRAGRCGEAAARLDVRMDRRARPRDATLRARAVVG
jgi:hypothetical protein